MNSKLFRVFVISIWLLTLVACATKPETGAISGVVAGAATCSKIGEGKGRLAAMFLCAVAGGIIGGSIGSYLDYMDEADGERLNAALEHSPTGQIIEWQNPDTNVGWQLMSTQTLQTSNGPCRKYQVGIIIDGNKETGEGTACRRPDGYWDIKDVKNINDMHI